MSARHQQAIAHRPFANLGLSLRPSFYSSFGYEAGDIHEETVKTYSGDRVRNHITYFVKRHLYKWIAGIPFHLLKSFTIDQY